MNWLEVGQLEEATQETKDVGWRSVNRTPAAGTGTDSHCGQGCWCTQSPWIHLSPSQSSPGSMLGTDQAVAPVHCSLWEVSPALRSTQSTRCPTPPPPSQPSKETQTKVFL